MTIKAGPFYDSEGLVFTLVRDVETSESVRSDLFIRHDGSKPKTGDKVTPREMGILRDIWNASRQPVE